MTRLAGLLVVAVVACNGGEMGQDAGDVADGAADALETDGIPAIDGPPGPCPDVLVPPALPPGAAPAAAVYRVTWRCIGGCATYPRPELTNATTLTIASTGALTWSGGIVLASTITGSCRRVAADDADGCRAYLDVCSSGAGVSVAIATWYDVNAQWRQSWEMTGTR